MHPEMTQLMDLQRLDVEAKRLRDELAALPRAVAQAEAKAKAIEGQRAVVLDLIAREDALRRRQESDAADWRSKIVRLRRQMDAATSTVQVSAYEHEIGFATAAIGKLEDAELESMERSEQLDAQRKVADDTVATETRRLATERERAATTTAAHQAALTALEPKRTAQRSGLSEESLSLYDRIARGKGTAVAEALLQKCLACQMLLRPQRWNDLRDRDNTERMTCDSCGRMLWYDPARDAPQRKQDDPHKQSDQRKPADPTDQMSIAARIVRGL
jgi:predicted  nucleic acid-binding Zn-ribbon protein